MNLKSSSKSGFTLIELLVVMLILVILTVTALPAIREYMIRARYTADVDPAIGNIRTKVELYRYEHDHLPGMQLATGTSALADTSAGNYTDYSLKVANSFIQDGDDQPSFIHSMSYSEQDPDNSGKPVYMSTEWLGNYVDTSDGSVIDSATDGFKIAEDDPSDPNKKGLTWHVFKQAEISYNDLRARFVAPYNFQYAVVYNKGEDYCWVVGAMGTGGGLPVGTGYAVLEYCNTALKTKFIATFERYKAESSRKPLTLAIDSICTTSKIVSDDSGAEKEYVVIEGAKETFPKLTDDINDATVLDTLKTSLNTFKDNLVKAGWKIE